MESGKKSISRNIVYKSFNYIKYFYKKNPIKIFSLALNNSSPLIEVEPKKSSNYNRNKYREIKICRRKSLAMRWIKFYSRIRKERFMYLKIANELIDASKNKGETIKKKNSFYKVFISKKNYKFKKNV